MAYMHGAYGSVQSVSAKKAVVNNTAFVYVGTAPIHTLHGNAAKVNKPILVNSIAEAREAFGWSEDFASYTLMEAVHTHLEVNGVAPLVLINVLDPATHKSATQTTGAHTPVSGKIVIANAESVILDTITVTVNSEELDYGDDYVTAYDYKKKTVTITEVTSGALGSSATVAYYTVTPNAVTATNIIGTTDNLGTNTGLYCIRDVYLGCGVIPAYLVAPGWSDVKTVHDAMLTVVSQINGHWDAYVLADLPLMNGETALTIGTVAAYKASNGYTSERETVFFPRALGTDGKVYHLSVLAAANLQKLLFENEGIPYMTASNTEVIGIKNLCTTAQNASVIYDDEIPNQNLVKNGISTAAFVGGHWVIWGRYCAAYNTSENESVEFIETNRMMLFYLSNDFQKRRAKNVDKPLTANDLSSIISDEQQKLDALVKIGALTYGTVELNTDEITGTDVYSGDYSFVFRITTTPLCKSLTAIVAWTDEGLTTFYDSFTA